MSFMTPILMVPSLICACAVPHPSAKANAARLTSGFIVILPTEQLAWSFRAGTPLDAEIVVQLFHVCVQFRAGQPVDDVAMFHYVVAIRNSRGETEILLNQQDGESLSLEGADGVSDLLNDHRGKALGRLVQQQEPRSGPQNTPDGEHLLFAARQLRPLAR